MIKGIAFNTLVQYLNRLVTVIFGIVITGFLTRELGPVEYGLYVFSLSFVMLANSIADWGITFIGTREAAGSKVKETWIGVSFVLRAMATLFVSILMFLFAKFGIVSISLNVLTWLFVLMVVMAMKSVLQIIFQGQHKLWKLSLIDTIGTIFFGSSLWLFSLRLEVSVLNILMIMAITSMISVIFGVLMTGLDWRKLKVSKRDMLFLGNETLSMGALLVVFSFYNKIDVFIIGKFRGIEEVGLYGLAYKIYENVILGAAYFANASFPSLAEISGDKSAFRRRFKKYLLFLTVGGVAAATLNFVFAGYAVRLIAGNSFEGAIRALQWLSLGVMVAYLNHAVGYAVVAIREQRIALRNAIFALVLNLSINLLLIPKIGIVGAAITTILTELLVFGLNLKLLKKYLGN